MRTLPHHIAYYDLFIILVVRVGFWKIPVIMVLPFLRNKLGEKLPSVLIWGWGCLHVF